jgi:hypothetical protein
MQEAPDDEDDVMRRALTTRMIGPSPQLADLLSQIHRDVKTTPEISRAYATRRKNACGALKVLSAKEENRLKLCWTMGMLDAISSVLNDVKTPTLDELSLNANKEARNRIVITLLHLTANKKNRMLICNAEGMLEAITQCIAGDEGESRQGCCMVLLQLVKTSETRPLLIRCPGLLDTLAKVIAVPKITPPPSVGIPSRKGYKNPYFKIFESHMSPGQSQVSGNPSGSLITPNDTTVSPEDTMCSPDETITDSEVESPRSPDQADVLGVSSGSFISPNDTTLSPGESMYSHEEEITDTEEEGLSASSSYSSCSSRSGPVTNGSHTEDHTEDHTESSESEVEGHLVEDSTCFEDSKSRGRGNCIIIQSMSEMEICFKSVDTDKDEKSENYDADPNQFLHGARLNIFGCLLCLVKSKENAVRDAL